MPTGRAPDGNDGPLPADAAEWVSRRATSFRRSLLAWYRKEARDLPWRRTKDPYSVWLSEIMLQQTRVEQGLPYYQRFLDAFPTVKDLASASEDRVLKLWEGLGYYSRARNLHEAARRVAREGTFPTTASAWQDLPGVGRYTAGAIASITLDERVPVVDGNVIRVLTRLLDIEACTNEGSAKDLLWAVAGELVPRKAPGDFNQALMELGARICAPRAPECSSCPVLRHCLARERGVQDLRPVRRPKAKTPHREMVVGAVRRRGRYLVLRRPADGLLGGLWELPGGAVRNGESHEQALARTLRDEFGLRTRVKGLIASVNHAYSHFRVTLNVYGCDDVEGTPKPASHTDAKWLFPSDFQRYAFPKGHHKFLHLLDNREQAPRGGSA